MFASRSSPRALRVLRPRFFPRKNLRFQSTTSPAASPQASGGGSGALTGGIAGALAASVIGYTWYHFSGAKTVVNSAQDTKAYFESILKKGTETAPSSNEAIKWLRDTTTSYAAFVPGAKGYVDSAFDDIDKIHEKHADEVDKIVKDTYSELKKTTDKGLSVEAVTSAWGILQTAVKKIGDLAGDAAGDILEQHPELKEQFGGKFDEMKKLGEQYGPDAKKKVEETWSQIQDIFKGGLGAGAIEKARKLIEEKVQEVKKLGDQAWEKGIEQAKPYLDKSPKIKKLVEENKDKLKGGNLAQLWDQVKKAAESGKTDDLEKYVKDTASKASESAGGSGGVMGLEQYFKMVPGGEDITSKLKQLQELGQKHGEEAEKLIKDAFTEIKDVLQKKAAEGEKLANKAKDDAKK